jgi:hypothetical protein
MNWPQPIYRWQTEMLRLWSMRVLIFWTVFWSALGGLCLVWTAFYNLIPLPVFVGLGILMPVSIALARLLKQPGVE